MTNLDFDRPGKGRIAKRRAFYLQPELDDAVSALDIAAQCTTSHGTWHTLLVGTLLRALVAGDVRELERHLGATLEASKLSHSKAQAKGQATLAADPTRRKRRHNKKS